VLVRPQRRSRDEAGEFTDELAEAVKIAQTSGI
jgi:preprotein translocase subunit YajC